MEEWVSNEEREKRKVVKGILLFVDYSYWA